MRVLIAGFGSAHGADSLGWNIADSFLEDLSAVSPRAPFDRLQSVPIRVKKFLHPSAAVSELESVALAVFIDAIRSDNFAYGEIISLPARDLKPGVGALSTHANGLNDALALARTLGTLPETALVTGINVYPKDMQVIPQWLCDNLLHRIAEYVSKHVAIGVEQSI